MSVETKPVLGNLWIAPPWATPSLTSMTVDSGAARTIVLYPAPIHPVTLAATEDYGPDDRLFP